MTAEEQQNPIDATNIAQNVVVEDRVLATTPTGLTIRASDIAAGLRAGTFIPNLHPARHAGLLVAAAQPAHTCK